jgi:hypothetical protein
MLEILQPQVNFLKIIERNVNSKQLALRHTGTSYFVLSTKFVKWTHNEEIVSELHRADGSRSASQEFPAFYGTLRFTTMLTRARHLTLSRNILVLSSYLRLDLPSDCWKRFFRNYYIPMRATCSDLYVRPHISSLKLWADFEEVKSSTTKVFGWFDFDSCRPYKL